MGGDVEKPNPAEAIEAMNLGHALSRRGNPKALDAACQSYSNAIRILDTIEKPISPKLANSLGAALMNRGLLIHRIHGTDKPKPAIKDFERAASILKSIDPFSSPWPRRNLVGTLLNHANLLLDLDLAKEAKSKAEEAIAVHEFESPRKPTDIELAVLSYRSFCDAAGQLLPLVSTDEQNVLASQAIEYARSGLSLIRSLRPLAELEPLQEASARLYFIGAQFLAIHNPSNLAPFLGEHLENLIDNAFRPQLVATALQTIPLAVRSIESEFLNPKLTPEQQDALAESSKELGELFSKLSPH